MHIKDPQAVKINPKWSTTARLIACGASARFKLNPISMKSSDYPFSSYSRSQNQFISTFLAGLMSPRQKAVTAWRGFERCLESYNLW